MASYRGHLTASTALGVAYGGIAFCAGQFDWAQALVAAGLTALGGLLPDLDSDSGVPVRELFGLAAAVIPFLLFRYVLLLCNDDTERALVVLAGLYLLIRYVLSRVFKRWTAHRGMFHSVPALFIAGLATYLLYQSPSVRLRTFLAGGVMLGFLSHLVLDELCSIDFNGFTLRLKRFAGSAIKFTSPSWPATVAAYVVLAVLAYFAWADFSSRAGAG